ncbi:MAG TPA: CpsB/CapC family capsule biosynthesis tyrosine phosphatase, partial [Thermomicrobiaceae bacterium]|nr:CpsB/CapC family capsule biosynthesis tyrosine phosphatase [Thermomicrobiaceae bacterium]
LQAAGFWPVLAHAERYPDVQRDPWIVLDLIQRGVPIQLNADSIAGPAERDAQPAAEFLLRHRLAHLIASDSHHARWRPPRVQAAYERVAELVGAERARAMQATASRIVRGLPVRLPPPIAPDPEDYV